MKSKIHPTAVVHPSAIFADGVEVGPCAVIGEDVSAGEGATIGAHAVVEHAVIGKGARIFSGAVVGSAPQDLKYKGEKARVVLGERCTIREFVTINRGTAASGETVIGSDCLLMAYAHVAHDCRLGQGVILANCATLAGHIEVGDHAVISGLVGMHQFVRVGSMAMISGGSMVSQDVPPYCQAQGDRARLVGLNLVGLRRAKVSREIIAQLKQAYKALFLSPHTVAEAVRFLRAGPMAPEVARMLDFVEASERGVCRPRMASVGAEERTPSGV
ncbi:MAG: acyl-[acyl-carrier-protein]--UDP-N-acetylglucosamine O-acyltransferase [Elusimicrobia bacterium RIFCSPLOWO2_12_FULL_59_9]|nr:MAG: acyl-[acyl-carrier-protein]--UDP-N-acetylglucosamine O-acyltransferase [Elusimicrobia bacterium RIFCSPLOWO2_12_FULL_59_9]